MQAKSNSFLHNVYNVNKKVIHYILAQLNAMFIECAKFGGKNGFSSEQIVNNV